VFYAISCFFEKKRPVNVVPKTIIIVLLLGISAQIAWHASRQKVTVLAKELPVVQSELLLRTMSLGETATSSRLLMLWLQAFDHQPGVSIPFRELDYDKIIAWLDLILRLDNRSQYPLLSASKLYSEVPDDEKKRQMLEFILEKFLEAPNYRWPWMTHAVYVAKHRLHDLRLARKYAAALSQHVTAASVPFWAKQMELFILDDMGDTEGAMVLLGGLLESGAIKDKNELKFLQDRLGLEQK